MVSIALLFDADDDVVVVEPTLGVREYYYWVESGSSCLIPIIDQKPIDNKIP